MLNCGRNDKWTATSNAHIMGASRLMAHRDPGEVLANLVEGFCVLNERNNLQKSKPG